MVFLGLVGWVVVGVLVGFIATKVVNLRGDDPKLGIAVTVGGGVVAGGLYAAISGAGVQAWNPWNLVFVAIGAVVATIIWHAVRSRYVSRAPQTIRRSY